MGIHMKYLLVIFATVIISGCSTVATIDRPDALHYESVKNTTASQESLFSSDNVLSDKEIKRILAYPLNEITARLKQFINSAAEQPPS